VVDRAILRRDLRARRAPRVGSAGRLGRRIVGAISFAATIIAAAWVIGWVTERLILPALAGTGTRA
jgi:hypothetical protein